MAGLQYGTDVAARRADDLDRAILAAVTAAVVRGQRPTVLDLGCGSGGQAQRLAQAGAVVTAVDIMDYSAAISAHNAALLGAARPIEFVQSDITTYVQNHTIVYDSMILQRVLHYMSYASAKAILLALKPQTTGQLYLSVTGVDSAIGALHPAADAPLPERFASLPASAAETFAITAPLCVYAQTEVFSLLQETGWYPERLWRSDFGNIKAVVRPETV